ncbi:hypothetical protein [Parapedobacter lycopersici]|uniref:hypothetical protein n=1 Tax=Parapedobacter lycopersici TaxID=1864939 RepID=UPI003342BC60
MKTTMRMLRTGLVGLFLMVTMNVMAQQTPPGPIDPLGPQSTTVTTGNTKIRGEHFDPVITDFSEELTNSILFFNPNVANGFTLRASTIEDHASRALEFTTYNWYDDGDGSTLSTTPIPGENSVTLPRTGLAPGYHQYRVEAFIIPPGADPNEICPPDQTETFVVFVLPQLGVGVTHTGANTSLLQYCEDEAATQDKVVLTADVNYEGYTGDPALDQFELKYTWYAVKSNNSSDVFASTASDFPTIDPSKVNIENANLQGTPIIKIGTTDTYNPAISDIGSYKFFVEVEYTIKDRNYDDSETNAVTNRARPYVIYRGWFGGNDQDNASIVLVTPKPGKPHITIETITD